MPDPAARARHSPSPSARFERLLAVMRALRAPGGCPWDREQTLESLRPFVLEETYELVEAIDRGQPDELREELGDYLYEAVFLAQISEDAGSYGIGDALEAITEKLIRRHPHVFTPDGTPLAEAGDAITSGQVIQKWEELKAQERKEAGRPEKTILSGVPRALPSLLRAYEISSRAAAVGFDWAGPGEVIDKIEEELAELREAVDTHGTDSRRAEEELGDLFFALANLSRKLGLEPETALRKANDKFQKRFEAVERAALAEGRTLKDLSLAEMEERWQRVKGFEGHEGGEGHEGREG
ncbi:MAG: nucleoside triphosphate pyrophosphohydrolase [Vicinamibacterales bacterium]